MLNKTTSGKRDWLNYFKNFLIIAVVLIGFSFTLNSCDTKQGLGIQESFDVIPELSLIEGGENSTIMVNRGTESYFNFEIGNIGVNPHIASGSANGWCILWDKPIESNNSTHTGLRLFSSYGDKQWKPLNYLLNVRESLMMNDSDLTYREIQVAIWSLMDFPEFNLNNIPMDDLPSGMVENGQYKFDRSKVDQIVKHVVANYESFEYSSASTYAVVAETPSDTQTIIIEVSESVWAYGQHSFRDPQLREQLGITGQGKGQWGWIFELDSDLSNAVTELIAGGGDDDGTMPAEEVGTIVGTLDISKIGNNMKVTYSPYSNYLLNDLHLWVGCSLEEFPWVGNTGNVAPGSFAYSYDDKPTGSHNFHVDLGDYECHGNIFLAAHAGKLYQKMNGELPDPVGEPAFIELIEIDTLNFGPFGYPDLDSDYVSDTYARAINDLGEVVGEQRIVVCADKSKCESKFLEIIPYRWMQDDGFVSGALPYFHEDEDRWPTPPVTDINNQREVVGFTPGFGATFLEPNFDNIDDAIFLSDMNAAAVAINDQSQVVGYIQQSQAFIWDKDNGLTTLGTLPGHSVSRATDINNLGQVVGWSSVDLRSGRRYFLWDKQNGMTELDTAVRSINDHGQMSPHLAINNLGQTVNGDGYLYDPQLGAIELPTIDGGDCKAVDLNDNGQVVGACFNSSVGQSHLFWVGNGFYRAVIWNVIFD